MDKKFSILIHPVNRDLLYDYEPGMRNKSISIVKKVLEWMSPFKVSDIEGIKSEYNGREVKGELIMSPLLMEQMTSLNPRRVFSKVKKAAKFAESRNPSLLGLAAYIAMVGRRGSKLKDFLNIPLTTGAHLSIASVPEAILRAVKTLEYKLEDMDILIFGANYISLSIILKLGSSLRKIYIYSSSKERLRILLKAVPKAIKKKIEVIGSKFKYILKWINLVVVSTNKIPLDFKVEYLRRGTILFDSSYPRKMKSLREDILIIDGISLQPPGEAKFNFNFGPPEGLCFPRMAEVIVLALEEKWENFSLGEDISIEKAEEIFRLALKHGFKIGPFTEGDYILGEDKILQVKDSLHLKKRKFFIIDKWLRTRR